MGGLHTAQAPELSGRLKLHRGLQIDDPTTAGTEKMIVLSVVSIKMNAPKRKADRADEGHFPKHPERPIHSVPRKAGETLPHSFKDLINRGVIPALQNFPGNFQTLMGQLHTGRAAPEGKGFHPLLVGNDMFGVLLNHE